VRRCGLFIGLLLCAHAALGADAVIREAQIKAAILYNFMKFITWPSQTFSDARAPFVVGIMGDSPVTEALQEVVRGRTVSGRAIVIHKVVNADDAAVSQLLFVAESQTTEWVAVQTAIAGKPIVTVGESPPFLGTGGILNFIRQDDKVRFEINLPTAERAGLRVSYQLIMLAQPHPKSSLAGAP